MASGSTPVIVLHGDTMKPRFPCRQFHRRPPMYSSRVHWVPLFPSAHRRGAFAVSPHPGVHGFPVRRLLCPIRLCMRALAFRWGLPSLLLHSPYHPSRRLPCSPWKTQTARDRWRVSLLAPSALCGSPVCGQRVSRLTAATAVPVSGGQRSLLTALVSACRFDWLTCETREVRASVPPQGFPTLQVMHHIVPQPSHHLLGAWLSLMGPFRSMPLTPESGR
jgi:hypothetical protein